MSISGFDIEDSVVLNKSSLERGLGRAFVNKKMIIEFERSL